MPSIRFSTFKHYALFIISISLNREIISLYSRCAKKGLVYITIISFIDRQPSSYFKYTKANICSLYNIRLVPFNKYIFLYHRYFYTY